MPVTLAVSAAAAIALGAGVPPRWRPIASCPPTSPAISRTCATTPRSTTPAAQEAIKNIPKAAPAVTVKETATTKAPSAQGAQGAQGCPRA